MDDMIVFDMIVDLHHLHFLLLHVLKTFEIINLCAGLFKNFCSEYVFDVSNNKNNIVDEINHKIIGGM